MGVSVRQQKRDGEWYVHIRHNGQRAAQKCVNKEHAEDVQKAVLQAIAAGQFDITKAQHKRNEAHKEEKKPSPTLGEFFDETITKFWKARSAGTFSRYEGDFRLHIRPVLGDVRLCDLSRDRVKDFIISLLQKNAAKRTNNEAEPDRKLAKDSVRNIVAALRGMLSEAVERGLIIANPA